MTATVGGDPPKAALDHFVNQADWDPNIVETLTAEQE